MRQTLQWSISGEFITSIAREWFWKENKPFKIVKELLENCLISNMITDEQRQNIIIDIIEGRKKLIGENELELVNDGENIRLIVDKLEETRLDLEVEKLKQELERNYLRFIDPFSTMKNIEGFDEDSDDLNYFIYPNNYYGDDLIDTPFKEYNSATKAGLWLLEEPELILAAFDNNHNEETDSDFWRFIYENTKNRKGFEERNKKYLASLRLKENQRENQQFLIDEDIEIIEKKPDNIIRWTGLISPKGNFYSCEFAEHTYTAYLIIVNNPNLFPNEMKYVGKPNISYMPRFDLPSSALDILINDYGWCATRYLPTEGDYITFPSNGKITQAQKDTIWEAIIKFDKHIKIPDILM